MSELKRKILETIARIALIVGIIMVLWRIFGNSPTDFAVITPFIIFGLAKIWSTNWELKNFKTEVRLSFRKVREDIHTLNKRRKND